jgi:pyrophosphatase PpaX
LVRCMQLLAAADVTRAVYVGDAPYDLQAAQAAGMVAVAVAWGVFPAETLAAERPERLVRTVAELAVVLGLDRPV